MRLFQEIIHIFKWKEWTDYFFSFSQERFMLCSSHDNLSKSNAFTKNFSPAFSHINYNLIVGKDNC